MPPAIPVAQAIGVVAAQAISFTTPAATKGRDSLLAIVASASANAGPDIVALGLLGWSSLATFTDATATIWMLRREAQVGDLGNISIPFLDALAWGKGALVVYRNLDNGAGPIASSATAIAAATAFVCPARALVTYSDLYLGIVLVRTAATAVAPPAGTTERYEEQSDARTLEIFEFLAEATGSTGTKTATTGANQSGIAASIALAADAIVGFGLSLSFDPVGTIGLPAEGV